MPTLATNKQARFDYEILERIEAGIVLSGHETKAAREGGMRLADAFVTFRDDEAFLTNAHISRYSKAGSTIPHDPARSRKLLLHRKQIANLIGKKSREGLTIVPLSAYTTGGLIKVELALARGKKKFDKRETIRKRELEREVARHTKRG